MLSQVIGLTLLIPGFMGIRWFYRAFRGSKVADNVLQPLAAFSLIILGIIGTIMLMP